MADGGSRRDPQAVRIYPELIAPQPQAKGGLTPKRRKQLVNLAMEACELFDKYEVLPGEKCYVGRLCQAILEF